MTEGPKRVWVCIGCEHFYTDEHVGPCCDHEGGRGEIDDAERTPDWCPLVLRCPLPEVGEWEWEGDDYESDTAPLECHGAEVRLESCDVDGSWRVLLSGDCEPANARRLAEKAARALWYAMREVER